MARLVTVRRQGNPMSNPAPPTSSHWVKLKSDANKMVDWYRVNRGMTGEVVALPTGRGKKGGYIVNIYGSGWSLPTGKRNPGESIFLPALVEGIGTGAGLAVSAGLLAPIIVDRAQSVAERLGLIKRRKRNPSIASRFPKAGGSVGGLKVRGSVPNRESIGATFDDWEELPGIRVVDTEGDWDNPSKNSRILELAEEIKASGGINPLIIVTEPESDDNLYILEGVHRYDALVVLGIRKFPAVVVYEEKD